MLSIYFVFLCGFKLAFHSNVISGVSASSVLPSPHFSHLWVVSKAQRPAIPSQMRFSGEALTVIREEGLNLRLSMRKDGEIRFRDGENPLSKQGGKKPFLHVVTILSTRSPFPAPPPPVSSCLLRMLSVDP